MSVRLPGAECGKCGALAPAVDWRQSALGVAYLVDSATGVEHTRTCAGVSPRRAPVLVRPAVIAEPVRVHVTYPPSAPSAPAPEPAPEPEPEPEPEPADDVAEPADYAEWLAEGDAYDQAERERAARRTRAQLLELDWPTARRAILANGGIGPSPDWPRDWIPGDLYREHGQRPDIIASEATITSVGGAGVLPWGEPDEAAMFDYLHRAWEEWKRAQQARRPRPRKVAPVAPAQALAEPAPAPDPMRSATLNLARLVADVADLVADGRAPRQLARTLADAARMLAEAQQ